MSTDDPIPVSPVLKNREIIVAVLDDGVDIDHPALKDAIWRNPDATSPDKFGRDFFLDRADPGHFDPRPKVFAAPFNQKAGNDIHGTPCAGLVGAMAPDGRAFGVAAGCRILAVKIFHADAFASDDRVGTAIQYATGIADILSLSWTAPESPLIESPINDAAANATARSPAAPIRGKRALALRMSQQIINPPAAKKGT